MLRLPWKTKSQILLEQIDFLRAQVAQLQNYVLMTGGGAPTGFPTWEAEAPAKQVDFSIKDVRTEAQRLYSTELEEDIEFQLQEGLIGQDEADRLMRQAAEIADDIELM